MGSIERSSSLLDLAYGPFEYKLFFTLVVQVHMKIKNNADE